MVLNTFWQCFDSETVRWLRNGATLDFVPCEVSPSLAGTTDLLTCDHLSYIVTDSKTALPSVHGHPAVLVHLDRVEDLAAVGRVAALGARVAVRYVVAQEALSEENED